MYYLYFLEKTQHQKGRTCELTFIMHIMNINDMGFWKPNQHYFTTRFRGPTTKINQYDCSIVAPVFSNIDQAAVSNDPVWSFCKMFCSFMTYVSERTCCHITDFRFEFTLVGYQSIARLKPRFEGGGGSLPFFGL